jgi:uncharacterized protein (TIGR04255 family)
MPSHFGGAFSTDAVEEIYLPRAPLAMALAQVRFPQCPELIDEDHLGQLRDRLKARYPILREDKAVGFLISAGGLAEAPPSERIVRFKDKAETWQVSIGQSFIALSTSTYSTRDDFCTRFEETVAAAADVASPPIFDRVGIRYINRFTGDDLVELGSLVTEPFLGLTSLDLTPASIVQSFTQTILHLAEGEITARWGLLPAGAVLDPALVPVDTPSWILDVDVYQERKGDFVAAEIDRQTRQYADLAYRFFRMATTDNLLRRAGGQT